MRLSCLWLNVSVFVRMPEILAAEPNSGFLRRKLAIAEAGRCGMSEAAPALSRMIEKGDPLSREAAAALIEMKTSSPDVLSALEQIATAELPVAIPFGFHGDFYPTY